jgi:hypothetical protein
MFEKQHFPREYKCEGCSRAATVTHEDVQDVPSFLAATTVAEAVEYVMTERRRWSLQSFEGALCPDCAEGEE